MAVLEQFSLQNLLLQTRNHRIAGMNSYLLKYYIVAWPFSARTVLTSPSALLPAEQTGKRRQIGLKDP